MCTLTLHKFSTAPHFSVEFSVVFPPSCLVVVAFFLWSVFPSSVFPFFVFFFFLFYFILFSNRTVYLSITRNWQVAENRSTGAWVPSSTQEKRQQPAQVSNVRLTPYVHTHERCGKFPQSNNWPFGSVRRWWRIAFVFLWRGGYALHQPCPKERACPSFSESNK